MGVSTRLVSAPFHGMEFVRVCVCSGAPLIPVGGCNPLLLPCGTDPLAAGGQQCQETLGEGRTVAGRAVLGCSVC